MLIGSSIAMATAVAVGQVGPTKFTPNHLFVTSRFSGILTEFDPSGAHVSEIDLAALGCSQPSGLAFGPDGRLYVASNASKRIFVFDTDGTKAFDFTLDPTTGTPGSITFGPDGNLYVGFTNFKGFEVRRPDGVLVKVVTAAVASDTDSIAVALDGRVITVTDGLGYLMSWDLSGLNPQQYIVTFTDTSSGGIAFDARGRLHAVFDDSVRVLTGALGSDTTYADEFETSDEAGITFGPDGNAWICGGSDDVVRVYDGETGAKLKDVGVGQLSVAAYAAFAPFRFSVEVEGKAISHEVAAGGIEEKGASLTLFPGSGRAFLQFDDQVLDASDFASLFSTTTIAVAGFEQEVDGKKRRLGGAQVPYGANTAGAASLVLDVKGKTNAASGFYEVKSASGTLHRCGSAGVLTAKVKTKKLLKG